MMTTVRFTWIVAGAAGLVLTLAAGLTVKDWISTPPGIVHRIAIQPAVLAPEPASPAPATVAPAPATVAPTPATVVPTPESVAPAPAAVAPAPETSAPASRSGDDGRQSNAAAAAVFAPPTAAVVEADVGNANAEKERKDRPIRERDGDAGGTGNRSGDGRHGGHDGGGDGQH